VSDNTCVLARIASDSRVDLITDSQLGVKASNCASYRQGTDDCCDDQKFL